MRPALFACTASPQPGVDDDDGGVGLRRDLDLDLAHAHRLDDHSLAADGVEQPDGLGRGQGQAAEVAARRHRADEHAGSVAWSCMRTGRRGWRRR
jgi:hypothetical protein